MPQAAITQDHGHVFVVPTEAFGLLAARRLDRDLFDVTGLIDAKYDDASTDEIPVIVDYGQGRPAAVEARSASVTAATRSVTIPRLGIAAFDADKDHARRFWDDLTAGGGPAGPTRLADGATRVDLDGRVEVVARGLGAADPRAGGLGGRLQRRGRHRGRARHGLRPHPPRPAGQGHRVGELHSRPERGGRERTRHPRRLDDRRQRRRVGRSPQGRRPRRLVDDRQGAGRRRLRGRLRGARGHGLGGRPGSRRGQHEPGR